MRRDSTGAQAGFNTGDEIIGVEGRVFASLADFAAYIGSFPPGRQITVDYIPAGGEPQQAQRVAVVVGSAGRAEPATSNDQRDGATSTGMSTGAKVAIGVGAVALLGCYEMGCFSHRSSPATRQQRQWQQQPSELQPK